jgi:hypothetical protein
VVRQRRLPARTYSSFEGIQQLPLKLPLGWFDDAGTLGLGRQIEMRLKALLLPFT